MYKYILRHVLRSERCRLPRRSHIQVLCKFPCPEYTYHARYFQAKILFSLDSIEFLTRYVLHVVRFTAMGTQIRIDVTERGRAGGKARAANMDASQRSESARKAVNARWEKVRAAKLAAKRKTRAKRKAAA